MPSAGSVHVDVLPDLKGFAPQLRSQLSRIGKQAGGDSGTEAGDAFARKWSAKVNNIPSPELTVTANTGVAMSRLTAVQAAADRLDGRTVTIDVKTRGSGPSEPSGRGGSGDSGSRGGSGGGPRPFTDVSPAMGALAWIGGPSAVPAVGALTGALGALGSGFAAAGTGAATFATAAVPAVRDVAGAIELQEAAAEGGEEATTAYRKAMEELTPAARNTVDAWGSLTSAYDEWQTSLQSDTLPVVTRGLGLLESQLPSLTPIVRNSAAGFDSLLDSSEAALGGDHWQRFTSFAARQAEPSIGILGRSVGNLAMGFTGLLVSFEPLWNTMGPGMEDLTRRFAAWSNESENFTDFISWVISEGPTFVSMFGSFAEAAIDTGVALAPLGTVYAQGLTVLADAISAVAEEAPWLLQAAVAAGTLRTSLGLLSRVNSGLIQPLDRTTTRLGDMATQMRSSATAGRGMRTALSGAVGLLGGPWGVALAAATTALGVWISQKQEATQQVQEFVDAIREDNGALAENSREVAANALEQEGALEAAEQLGLSMEQVTDAALGQGTALSDLNDTLDEREKKLARQQESDEITLDRYGEQINAVDNLRNAVSGKNNEVNEAVESTRRETEAAGEATEQQNTLNGSMARGAYQARDYKAALDELTRAKRGSIETEIGYKAAVDRASNAVQRNGRATDVNTEAGRDNREELLKLAEAGDERLASMKANERGSLALRVEQDKQRQQFVELAEQMGYTGKEARDLADDILGIPPERMTELGVTGTGEWRTGSPEVGGLAMGGPVAGPGTATSDSIPAMLSDGEFVEPTSTVDYYGTPFFEALRHRAIPKEALTGFATGGVVTTRAQGNTPWDRVDDQRRDTLREHDAMMDRMTTAIAEDMAEKWANQVQGPLGVAGLAEASIGKFPEVPSGSNVNPITSWYGMNGAPWCSMFISWLFSQAGASDALGSASRTAWTGDYYTSGMPRAGAPMPGDVAVYGTDHVNLVTSPGGDRRIGGNQSNNVTAGSSYSGGSIFRPMWSRAGFATGGLVDILSQDRREDGRHPLLDSLRGLAGGGLASGWTVVGEEGPELARFDDPATIYSNQESARMAKEGRRAEQSRDSEQGGNTLIGVQELHMNQAEGTVREVIKEMTHAMRVVDKSGRYGRG